MLGEPEIKEQPKDQSQFEPRNLCGMYMRHCLPNSVGEHLQSCCEALSAALGTKGSS